MGIFKFKPTPKYSNGQMTILSNRVDDEKKRRLFLVKGSVWGTCLNPPTEERWYYHGEEYVVDNSNSKMPISYVRDSQWLTEDELLKINCNI